MIYKGKTGNNLILTINTKLQNDVRKIMQKNMLNETSSGGYAVVMNPKTGSIYSMVGIDRNPANGKRMIDDSGVVNKAQVVGSVVKPALETTALMRGVITPTNNTLTDQPIKIFGTPAKTSWFNHLGQNNNIKLTAPEALEVSSNTYMMQINLKMGGLTYHPNMKLNNLDPNIFNIDRNGFAKFGMGVKTGIDLPYESTGLKGSTSNLGFSLDEAFGQYDTYTPMQLAQYVSTIANGGYRIKPHLLKAIQYETDSGVGIVENVATKILNTVGWTTAEKNVIYHGMYLVTHGNSPYVTAGPMFRTLPVPVSMKTGDSQTFGYKHAQTVCETAISFVPNSNVAMVVMYPNVPLLDTNDNPNENASYQIWKAVLKDLENAKTLKKSTKTGIN